MNIFFDVQGTLVARGVLRPHTREVFLELIALGHDIYLWSSAGSGYASMAARALGVSDIVFGYYSKLASPPITVDYALDDCPDLAEQYGGYAITPFDGDPEDRELWQVVERLR
jgi:hypothetical protein